jgi:hypothetical protein
MYFGPGGLAPNDYFTQHGHPAQPGHNIADHLLDIASEPTDELLGLARRKSASRHSGTTAPATGSNSDLRVKPDLEKSRIDTPKEGPKQAKFGSSRLVSTYSTTFLTQLQVLCGREWKILKRSFDFDVRKLALNYFQGQVAILCSLAGCLRTWSFLRWTLFQDWYHNRRIPKSHWMSILLGAPCTL